MPREMSGKPKSSKKKLCLIFPIPNQTMPCDWREGALGGGHHSVRRKRRSAGNITAVLPDHLVEDEDEDEHDTVGVDRAPKSLGNFSESLNLFQSIQVLANEEEERAFMNETASSEFHVKGNSAFILRCNRRSFGGRSGFLFLLDDLHVSGGGRHHPPHHLRPLHQPALRESEEARQRWSREYKRRCPHPQVFLPKIVDSNF